MIVSPHTFHGLPGGGGCVSMELREYSQNVIRLNVRCSQLDAVAWFANLEHRPV